MNRGSGACSCARRVDRADDLRSVAMRPHAFERRWPMRDPDGYSIEVGQTTAPVR